MTPTSSRKPRARAGGVFVDSGAWIAFFSARDRHHSAADTLIRRCAAARTRILTTNLVLAEVHRLLLHRAGIRAAAAALDHICRSSLVEIVFADAPLHERARTWLAKLDDQTITYTDAISFAVIERAGCASVLTFDRDFDIAGFARLA